MHVSPLCYLAIIFTPFIRHKSLQFIRGVNSHCHAVQPGSGYLLSWPASMLLAFCFLLLTTAPAFADTFTYDDEPPSPIAFDDVGTVICNEPLPRTFAVTDSFLVQDIDLGFNADHAYRVISDWYWNPPKARVWKPWSNLT